MSTSLSSRVAERRRTLTELVRKRDDLSRQIEIAEIELRAYEDALKLVAGDDVNRPTADIVATLKSTINPDAATQDPTQKNISPSYAANRMTDRWYLIFKEMEARRPKPISIPEIAAILRNAGIEPNEQSLRSGLHKFVGRDWLVRSGYGEYKISPHGVDALRVRERSGGGTIEEMISN